MEIKREEREEIETREVREREGIDVREERKS